MTASPSVAVLHIRTERPHAPEFQKELDTMNDSVLAQLDEAGWSHTLTATAEVGMDEVREIARAADAVLVMGGEDVAPEFYGGPADYPGKGHHEPEADRVVFQVMHDAIAEGRPLLAICRGVQQLNVALGGTLHQDIPGHERKDGDYFVITPVTALEQTGITAIGEAGPVMCAHHQALDQLGDGLRVTARASDGTIEAVEHESAPVVGVQWHPEHPGVSGQQLVPLLREVMVRANVLSPA
ncbi:gamma-glutamyl-gamma-aminobutyrate hydrolase family protein [Salinibacterium sp. ZJ70]|uniref:gamma-glutamyl-gamma-aminobutyrate hydrolase family protein n=1 Tax=Salinibacterium sp. ZJ70 TaxID=2708084 RepID=UPI001421BB7B|nr:gamma-glutamyl-gamma-aminobutyrate hydrolase family protein [Salinibacterium sp. ZJ70]